MTSPNVLADYMTENGLERLALAVLAAGILIAAALVFVGMRMRKP